MSGNISSLGIGSGVLTSDIIDQLKEADVARIIKPIETKITLNAQAQDAEELLTSLMKNFKASASALSYDTIFDNKTVTSSGATKVTVDAGASIDSFSLETVTLAKKDITSLGALSSSTTAIATGAGTLSINGTAIAYDATTTLDDLAQLITDALGSTVSASVLETGTNSFNLVLSSVNTGASEALTITDDTGLLDAALFDPYDATTNPTGYQNVQAASDSEFKYNGVTVTRSTNEISDLILGVNITLAVEGDTSAITIEQDTSAITDELQQFVSTYNTLIQNISDMVGTNDETGAVGVFNGQSLVRGITNDINNVITAFNTNNDSLVNYGIDISRTGTMSFDQSVFDTQLAADPTSVKELFTGGTDTNGNAVAGWFTNINDKLDEYTGYGNLLSTFATDLNESETRLNENYTKAQDSLNSRYEIMTKRFIAYDGIISRLNARFSSLQMIIASSVNSN